MNTSLLIGDIQKAVAKECRYWRDTSKDNITIITKAYLKQLEKDGYTIMPHKQTLDSNSTRVNFFIDHED
jgi:hypothetical protein